MVPKFQALEDKVEQASNSTGRSGWTAPDQARVSQEFFDKHGRDNYTEDVDRKWRRMGALIEKGSRIRDGYLGR